MDDIQFLDTNLFSATASPRIAVLTSSSSLPRRFAPEQGARPDTVNTTTKLRLLALPTARVSTAIRQSNITMLKPSDFPKARNLKRIDIQRSKKLVGTHGWQVAFKLGSKWATKLFSDSKYGGIKNSYNAAINFKDSFLIDWHAISSKKRQSNQPSDMPKVVGVNFIKRKKKSNSSEYSSYWQAQWPADQKGKKNTKNFFVATYGYEKAYDLAVQARLDAVGELQTLISSPSIFSSPKDPTSKLWRYLDFTKFVSLLEKNSLFFVYAEHLNDPFEGSISGLNKSLRPTLFEKKLFDNHVNRLELRARVAVNSWHINTLESAAMWKLYAQTNEAVCIQTNYKLLRHALPPIFNISTVKYVDYNSEYIPEYHPLAPFLFKRKSFEHEMELRAIVDVEEIDHSVFEILGIESSDYGIYKAITIENIVENVYVAPDSPDWFYNLVKSVCKTYKLSNTSVIRSSLETEPFF